MRATNIIQVSNQPLWLLPEFIKQHQNEIPLSKEVSQPFQKYTTCAI